MKKITTVLAALLLAVALVISVGAADLGDKWTSLDETFYHANIPSMDCDEFAATDNNTLKVTANSDEADWGAAGATLNIGAAAKENLKIEFYNDYLNSVGNGDSFGILIVPKGTKVSINLTLGGQIAYVAESGSAGVLITFLANADASKYNIAVWKADGSDIMHDHKAGWAVAADGKYTVELVPSESLLKINGNEFALDASLYNTIEDADMTIGQIVAGDGIGEIELYAINGKAANTWPDGDDYVASGSTAADNSSAATSSSDTASTSSTASTAKDSGGCGNKAE